MARSKSPLLLYESARSWWATAESFAVSPRPWMMRAMLRSGSSPLQASQSARLAAAAGAVAANNAAVPIRTRNMRMIRPVQMGSVSLPDREGKGRRFFPAAASAPGDDRVQSAWSGVGCTTGFSLGTFERWLPRWAQGIGSENFGIRRVLRVLPLVTPRVGKTWNAGLRSNQQR